MNRRDFLGSLAVGAAVTSQFGCSQQPSAAKAEPAAQDGKAKGEQVKAWAPKVERLYKVAGMDHPNALETTPDGLWVGDQISERVMKVDWESGKVLADMTAESHNLSGLAVGGGYLWVGSNGRNSRRPERPTDRPYGEISQLDMKNGKIVKTYRLAWPGGIHGMTWVPQTNSLWITALSVGGIAEVDVKDNMRVLRMFPARGDRAHGIDWDNGAMWVLYAGELEFRKLDISNGKVLEAAKLTASDPEPHGVCIRNGYMYYCDAGLTETGPGSAPGYICRFKLDSGMGS
ncbi:MAG: hypothetical protein AB7O65_05015 [Candidatus Korobacteraceae bacterium]